MSHFNFFFNKYNDVPNIIVFVNLLHTHYVLFQKFFPFIENIVTLLQLVDIV